MEWEGGKIMYLLCCNLLHFTTTLLRRSPAAMPIHYALLARERVVLCDCATTSGTFERVASSILEGLSPTDTKISYESGVHLFHTMVSEGLTYMCVTETLFDRRVAFSFLVELKRQLAVAGLQQKAEYVGPYALRGGFSGVMQELLQRYSSGDKLGQLEAHVQEVKDIMTANIEKVVSRGEALEDLTDRSEKLQNSSVEFRVNATKLKRKIRWKCVKLTLVIVVIFLVILAVIAVLIGLGASGKFNSSSNNKQ